MGDPANELRSTVHELEALTWELERRGRIPPDYGRWIGRARAKWRWDYRHFREMQSVLNRVTAGELKRVIFEVPIRHGKTEHNTYGYLGYHFERNPQFRGLLGSYNQPQADKFGREVRRLVRDRGVPLSRERDAASDWETEAGGGLRAVGAGSGVASVNADGIVIDDPIGSRQDAESLAKRSQVFDWITNDILARAEPHTWVLLTMSRWHMDDPVARLVAQQPGVWHVVRMPALAEANDLLGRKLDEPLWPEERPRAWLDQKRVELSAYGFASLMQLSPRPRDGGMFKWEDWRLLEQVPVVTRLVRYWDLAGTRPKAGKNDPDFSAGTLAGRMEDQRTVILHQSAFRLGVGARDAKLEEIARRDRAAYGSRVEWWIERESGIGGTDRTDAVIRRIQARGLKVTSEPATGSKELRAEPLQSAVEAGNALLGPDDPDEPWCDAFRLEAGDFPNSTYDDRVDSAAGAYNKLTLAPSRSASSFEWRTV